MTVAAVPYGDGFTVFTHSDALPTALQSYQCYNDGVDHTPRFYRSYQQEALPLMPW